MNQSFCGPTGGSYAVRPLVQPVKGAVAVPGSKSITARALIIGAMAHGTTQITGALDSDDTRLMVHALQRLGVRVLPDWSHGRIEVEGLGGFSGPGTAGPGAKRQSPPSEVAIDAGLAGTVARFVTPLVATRPRDEGPVVIDGTPRMRERPMEHLLRAIRDLGAQVDDLGTPGHLPVRIWGPATGGRISLPGDVSSQFLSGLLLAAPAMPAGLQVELSSPLVSRPYVEMTLSMMSAFGVAVECEKNTFKVAPGARYRARGFAVEPDASAASYVFAAAAITGSRLEVKGIGTRSCQGDVGFVNVLLDMGCQVEMGTDAVAVAGPKPLDRRASEGPLSALDHVMSKLRGVEVDMSAMSDVAQTLAAVAPFASSPTRITGIGFIRRKETDRIAATVFELRRCGVRATAQTDGLVIEPSSPQPAVVETWGDHRVAMSMALLGLRTPGIVIADPAVTSKTFPGYFAMLESLHELPALR